MNKYLILLGLVLIASLSFAKTGSDNWMQTAEGRYDCMYEYDQNLLDLIGPDCYIIPEEEYIGIQDTYFESKTGMLGGMYTMYYNSGCDLDPVSASGFRSGMVLFNTNSFAFKRIFLADIKDCLSTSECECDRGDILGYLNGFHSDYTGCISDNAYCVYPTGSST